ncbi:MAG: DUF4430 domain-containing protein [Lachnospiraceae bacterium]|nr:DUF4430 domain-containing protein [Lachnospiraceae bacterium]
MKKKTWIWVCVLVVLVALFALIYHFAKPKAQAGSKAITLTVVDDAGDEKVYNLKTDEEYLYDALKPVIDKGDLTIDAEESAYGLYIKGVNGLTADYDKDGAYWAIYVNGEYGQFGIESQPVADGDAYKLVYEKY